MLCLKGLFLELRLISQIGSGSDGQRLWRCLRQISPGGKCCLRCHFLGERYWNVCDQFDWHCKVGIQGDGYCLGGRQGETKEEAVRGASNTRSSQQGLSRDALWHLNSVRLAAGNINENRTDVKTRWGALHHSLVTASMLFPRRCLSQSS